MQCALSLSYGGHPRQRFDLFIPDGAEDRALLIALQGGWWSGGRHEDLRPACLVLAEHGIPCASLGMRPLQGLGETVPGAGTGVATVDGPRHGEELLQELRTAIATVLEEAALLGLDGRSVALLGSGSGSLVALMLASQLAEDRRLHLRAALACGVTPSLEAGALGAGVLPAVERFAHGQREALSPQTQRPDSFPPLLLIHGSGDSEVPLAAVQRFQARQQEAGEPCELVVVGSSSHQFLEQPYAGGGREALQRLVPYLREHLDNPREPAPNPRSRPAESDGAGGGGEDLHEGEASAAPASSNPSHSSAHDH